MVSCEPVNAFVPSYTLVAVSVTVAGVMLAIKPAVVPVMT